MVLEELLWEHQRLSLFTRSNLALWISQAKQYFLFTWSTASGFPVLLNPSLMNHYGGSMVGIGVQASPHGIFSLMQCLVDQLRIGALDNPDSMKQLGSKIS